MYASLRCAICLSIITALAGCAGQASLANGEDTGPDPVIAEPAPSAIPTVNIAPAEGWPANLTPTAASGLSVKAFATGLDHPRWLYVLPNGDVLVAESNGPGKPGIGGIKGKIMGSVMKRAGAGTPSPNRITLLRDRDGDGVAETRSVFASGLSSPFGMALVGDTFYIANADSLVRARYHDGDLRLAAAPTRVADLPGKQGDKFNHHWTKSLLPSADGSRFYIGVGSNSNIAENGIDVEADRAAVLELDPASGSQRIYASGLRNPVGLAWEPHSQQLWAVVNERDELGNDLVPDYLTRVDRGAFYGWPYSYYGQHVDTRVKPQRPDLVASARRPDYALGSHVAPLGLAFASGGGLGGDYAEGAFVGLHGSWNRKPLNGYKVVFVPFRAGSPVGQMRDVLTGFLDDAGNAHGRPVGVVLDRKGALLVADDVGNVVWRVSAAAPGQ